MGDADERPKQVVGVKIFSQIAALFSAPHQFIDRSLDQAARAFIEPGRTSDQAVESGRNDMLRRDVIDEEQHPGSQGFDRRHCFSQLARRCGQLFHLASIDSFDQRIPRGEMAIQRTGSNAGLSGNLVKAGVCAESRKCLFRNFQNALSVALGIRARLASGGLERLSDHARNFLQPEIVSGYLLFRRVSPF